MGEENRNKEFNSFVKNVVTKVLGYGLGIVLASLILASFPSCSADTDKIEAIIPGFDYEVNLPSDTDDGIEETPVPEVPDPEPVAEYIDIESGYKIDKNGDYSKLRYPEALEIVNDRIIYFKDSEGKMLSIRSSGSGSASSVDNPSAAFAEDSITLRLRDLTLVFIKK